jgi:hypothetical protein
MLKETADRTLRLMRSAPTTASFATGTGVDKANKVNGNSQLHPEFMKAVSTNAKPRWPKTAST